MKVCKFEKMKEEDEIRQVINYILKEHPYVVVVPTLTQLQEWLQDRSEERRVGKECRYRWSPSQ